MQRIALYRAVGVVLSATLFFDCSGGLPGDDDEALGGSAGRAGGAGHGGHANGGTLGAQGGTSSVGGDSAGMAGTIEPNGGYTGSGGTSVAPVGGTPGSAGEGGWGGNAGAAGEAGGGIGASGGRTDLGKGGGAGTAGVGGTCGVRQCDSSADKNCNHTPDNQEAACECPTPNAQRQCSTGKSGACAVGTQQCNFSQDKSQSSWSSCVGPSAGSRDCRSASDNNCNGVADNQEPECTACTVGVAQACNTHPEDGTGLCKAGSRSCSLASDNASVVLGPCTGDVGPTMEACGPFQSDGTTLTADANCNGLRGDGDYQLVAGCAKAVSVGGKSVQLFASARPGTVAIHSCETICPVNSSFSYIALSCPSEHTTDTVLGYAPTAQLSRYVPVSIAASSCVYDGGTYGDHYKVEVAALTFYALP